MAVQVTGSVRNAALVAKKFEDFANSIPQIGSGRFYGRLIAAQKKVTTYPPKFSGKMEFASQKQRRYVIWAIRTGKIKVPYERTGEYGRSWKVIKVENGYMLRGQAIRKQTGEDYTVHVSGSAFGLKQARIHQGRWMLARKAMEEALRGLPEDIHKNVRIAGQKLSV